MSKSPMLRSMRKSRPNDALAGREHRDNQAGGMHFQRALQDFQNLQKKLFGFDEKTLRGLPRSCAYAKGMDRLITQIYQDERQDLPFAIVATGGYGRGRLAPFSDIDLLFIVSEDSSGAGVNHLIERCLYVLWDLHIPLGHSSGSASEIMAMACDNISSATALIDARLVCGSQEIYADFLKKRQREMARRLPRHQFIKAKIEEAKKRHKKHGASRYMLEPNIKEGRGALRDLDILYWICSYAPETLEIKDERGLQKILGADLYHSYQMSENFLWDVRVLLHEVAQRKGETLTLEIQPEIARWLGYRASKNNLGKMVERFMRHYFLNAREIGFLAKTVTAEIEIAAQRKIFALPKEAYRKIEGFKKTGRFLAFDSLDAPMHQPLLMLKIFETAMRHNLRVHPKSIRMISQYRKLLVRYRSDKQANALFIAMLTAVKNGAWALKRLNETGLLGVFIPQFRNIIAQVQFNRYHHYTTDAHTLYALEILSQIEQGHLKDALPLATMLANQKAYRRHLLYCALFLHDIGKGQKQHHSIVGEATAYQLCPRLGFRDEEVQTIAWLVRYHLTMSNTAFKRDLLDAKTVLDFANLVQTPEKLRLLLMLTIADIRAVSQISWTNHKASLLYELYERTLDRLYHFPSSFNGGSDDIHNNEIAGLKKNLIAAFDDWAQREEYVHSLTENYLAAYDEKAIMAHGRQIQKLQNSQEKWVMTIITDEQSAPQSKTHDTKIRNARIEFIAHWHKKCFTDFSAILALSGQNTFKANLFRIGSAYVIAAFDVLNFSAYPRSIAHLRKMAEDILGDERLAKMQRFTDLKKKLADESQGQQRLSQNHKNKIAADEMMAKSEVTFHLNDSELHSLAEVSGQDRQGLLYQLADALSRENVQIGAAKIATFGNQAVDVFYIKDEYGFKITNPKRIDKIKQNLLAVLHHKRLNSQF